MNCPDCKTKNPSYAKFCCGCSCELSNGIKNFSNRKEITSVESSNKIKDLSLSEKQFYSILEASLDAIIATDSYGNIVFWNELAEKLLGYLQEDVIGKPLNTIIIPERFHHSYVEIFKNLRQTKNVEMFKTIVQRPLKRKDESEFMSEISFSTIELNDHYYIFGVLRDVTERVRQEHKINEEKINLEVVVKNRTKELNKSLKELEGTNKLLQYLYDKEKEYRQEIQIIYHGIDDSIAVIEIESNQVVSANTSFCNLFGYSEKTCLKLNIKNLHPEDVYKDIYSKIYDTKKVKNIYLRDVECIKRNKTIFYADIRYTKISFQNKPAYIIFFRDNTEKLNLEKTRQNFIATLSHDLRVPLLAESNTLKYLIKGSYGQLTDKQLQAAQNMLDSNKDLLRLVNTLLDVYKFESDVIKLQKEEIILSEIIDKTILKLSPLIEDNNKSIKSNLNGNNLKIKADFRLLERVFINIIGNAIEHTQNECVIKIAAKKNKDFVTVKISDNGPGISEEEINKIFDIYYTSSKKFRKVGTGLGLYLSKQIINAHGGNIWAESESNSGSSFFFTLPVCN